MIRFTTTVDDVIAFNKFHCANSPSVRRQIFVGRLILPALLGLMFLWFLSGEPDFANVKSHTLIVIGMLSIAWFFGFPYLQRQGYERNVRKLIDEGPRSTLVGWRELELVGDRLRSRAELAESLMDLRAIIRIAGTDRHTFIYISPLNAIIIPMDEFRREEFAEFVQELRSAWQRRDELPPLGDEWGKASGDDRISAR